MPGPPVSHRLTSSNARAEAAGDAATVWRYMDLAKFVDLVDSRCLHLTRLDRLQDPYEGTPPLAGPDPPPEAPIRAWARRARRATYVSSWYLGEEESEAMWRLYCPGGQGVALCMPHFRLAEIAAAYPDTYVGRVRYVDFDGEPLPAPDLLTPVLYKRIAFAHEREVRLVAVLRQALDDAAPGGPPDLDVKCDPERLVERVYVNPYAQEHFAKAVHAIVRRMAPALEPRLTWSQLTVAPIV